MRVLHLWLSDCHGGGGGAIAMNRLHSALVNLGVESRILCSIKTTDSELVTTIRPWPMTERVLGAVTSRLGLNDIHRISSFGLTGHDAYQRADLLHIHGTHTGFLNYLALPRLARRKPIVFTLHDMWALTGHCAYSFECERWRSGCGKCPHLDYPPAVQRDATRLEWRLKRWSYRAAGLRFVSPSLWLYRLAQEGLPPGLSIEHIPNGIDTSVFRPLDRRACRDALGIPLSKSVLLLSTVNVADHRKGGDLLVEALRRLSPEVRRNLLGLFVGRNSEGIAAATGIETISLGYVEGDALKAAAYSAADLFVHPTRAENFALVLLESLACGTPVVSFEVGGVPEIVRPQSTGYLAAAGDATDLARGIVHLLTNTAERDRLARNAREVALQEYTLALQACRHRDLYSRILDDGRVGPERALDRAAVALRPSDGAASRNTPAQSF